MAFRFRKFEIYQLSKNLHKDIYDITGDFSRNNYYIVDQIRRSSLSIILNIAEGSSKQSDKDFNRFLSISLGSIDETVACLEICLQLGIIAQKQFSSLEEQLEVLSLRMGAFSKKLKSSGNKLFASSK